MTHKEALRLALEALELCTNQGMIPMYLNKNKEAITAIKFALANEALERKAENARELGLDYEPLEAKDEPVAWISPTELLVMRGNALGGAKDWRVNVGLKPEDGDVGLYTTPPQRKPLTDEEIEKLIFKSGGHKSTQNLMSNPMQVREHIELWNERIYAFARAIEAAHGIKGEA